MAKKEITPMGDNVRRLLGMHKMSASNHHQMLGISAQAISELQTGKRQSPRFETVGQIAHFFEIPMERLHSAPFEDLLANELADPERFRRVEEKILKARRVVAGEASAERAQS